MAHRKVVLCLLGAALATSMISGCSGKKSDPVTVTVWTYYNGDQLDAFNDLTEKFNDTVGKKDGITVETKSLGTAEDLEQNVLAAVNGEVPKYRIFFLHIQIRLIPWTRRICW